MAVCIIPNSARMFNENITFLIKNFYRGERRDRGFFKHIFNGFFRQKRTGSLPKACRDWWKAQNAQKTTKNDQKIGDWL